MDKISEMEDQLFTRPLFFISLFKNLDSLYSSSFQNCISVFQVNLYEYLWAWKFFTKNKISHSLQSHS